MQRITPCLWFDSNAEEAAKAYTALFPHSRIGAIARYGESGAKAARRTPGSVMTVTFALNGVEFMALNGGPLFKFSPSVSFFVTCGTAGEVDALWESLSAGGTVLMPLDRYAFGERYGWLTDRFGVSWQLMLSDQPRAIAPFLMFTGDHAGKAQEAMHFYMSVFDGSKTLYVSRYEQGEGDRVGSIKHAGFLLDRQKFLVMDNSHPHGFDFVQAVSFIVNCRDQRELDRFWEGLSAGGATSVGGWLSDRYGIPWQVVPAEMGEMMKEGDAAKQERVMAALLKMTRPDIAELQRAAAPA